MAVATKTRKGKGKASAKTSTTKAKAPTAKAGKAKAKKSTNGGFDLRSMTDKQRTALGKKIAQMRGKGSSWAEVQEETGVPGSITGRKLMREADPNAEAKIEARGAAAAKPKGAKKSAKGKASAAKGKATKAKTTAARGGKKGKAKSGN